jgi:hypothetical protein
MFEHGKSTDAVAEIQAAVARVAAEDRSGWSDGALCDRLRELLETRERLDAEILALAGTWDARRSFTIDGARRAEHWLEHRCDLSPPEAKRVLRSARLVRDHDRTDKALCAGDITTGHVDALARAAAGPREAMFDVSEDDLVDAALTTRCLRDFEWVTRRWARIADGYLDQRDATTHAYHLHLSATYEGAVRVDGLLDPVGGALVMRALETEPDPADAPARRSLSQRLADALVDLCRAHLTDPKTGKGSGAEVLVLCDLATLAGEPGALASVVADIDGIGPVAPEAIRRLACDGVARRVLVDAAGDVLDLGRRTRTVTDAQRRAVIARDRHCRFPGCRRSSRQCQVHHLVFWDHGGTTDIHNLCLVCWYHHRLVHEHGWALQWNDHEIVAVRPNGTRVHDPP